MDSKSTTLNTIVLNGVFVTKDENYAALTAETSQFSVVVSSFDESFSYRVLETLESGHQRIELTEGSFIHSIKLEGSDQTIPIKDIWVSHVMRGDENYILFECTAEFNGGKQTLSLIAHSEGDLFSDVRSADAWAALTPLIDYQGPVSLEGFREGDTVNISEMSLVSSSEVEATSYLVPGIFLTYDSTSTAQTARQDTFEFVHLDADPTFQYEIINAFYWDNFSVYQIQETNGSIFNAVRVSSTGELIAIDRIWSSQVDSDDESYVLLEMFGNVDGQQVNLFSVVYAEGCYFSDVDSAVDFYGKTPTNDFQGWVSIDGYRVGDLSDVSTWNVVSECDVETPSLFENIEGDDNVAGTAGLDLAVYTASKNDFTLTNSAGVIQITNGLETDTLTNFERVKFSDGAVAFDLGTEGSAGRTAKILGAVFGADSVNNEVYAGIGIDYLDRGTPYEDLTALAIDVAVGTGADSAAVVNHLYTNVVGVSPSAAQAQTFIDLLDNGTYTKGSLGVLAAETGLNIQNINLLGLAETGLDYIPVG